MSFSLIITTLSKSYFDGYDIKSVLVM